MNKITRRFLLLLIVFTNINGNAFLQTYSYTYTVTYFDTITSIDPVTKKELWNKPSTSSIEQNFVRAGNYGLCFTSRKEYSLPVMDSLNTLLQKYCSTKYGFAKLSFTLYDYYKHLTWNSSDSSFSAMEYLSGITGVDISSKLIQYNLEPDIYIIVDKDIPSTICPNIFVDGLKYGIRKLVSNKIIIELKTYSITQSTPSQLGSVAEIFTDISPSSVTKTYPPYPKKIRIKRN